MLGEKVRHYIEKHRLLRQGDRVLVAVSGGPDSLCLLHLLRGISSSLQLELVVAHLDHQIRPEAGEEARLVKDLATSWSLPFTGASYNVPSMRSAAKLSEEEAARRARYRFLYQAARNHRATVIAVGHHRDDQAETVLLNLLRGTGPDGLAGMLPRRFLGKIRLIRPLLVVSREEIECYCRDHGLRSFTDRSNLEEKYTRNRVRLELIPHLEKEYNPRLKESLARLAVMAAADRRYLRAAAEKQLRKLSKIQGKSMLIDCRALNGLPEALRGRVARQALEQAVPGKRTGWKQVRKLLALAGSLATGKELSLPGGIQAYRSYGRVVIRPRGKNEDPMEPFPMEVPGRTLLPGMPYSIDARFCHPSALKWPPPPECAYIDYDTIPGELIIRTRWPGARFHPQGAAGSKKLKDFYIDRKVPRHSRDRHPLVTTGQNIVWVVGLRIGDPYRVTKKTRRVLVLQAVS